MHQLLKIVLTTGVAAAIASPMSARAWGVEGHKIVAAVAWDHLTPAARAQAQQLLNGMDEPTLPGVASWADEHRSRDTASLHYINFTRGDCHYTPALCPDGMCVVGGIRRYYAQLKDKSNSFQDRQVALVMSVHLLGDISQPLHAGWDDDRGGNSFQVRFGRQGANIHKVWDSLMIEAVDADWQDYAARLSQRPTLPGALAGFKPEAWAEESCRIVNTPGFYPSDRYIDQAYVQQWQNTLNDQLTIGGQRLAAVLNSALQ